MSNHTKEPWKIKGWKRPSSVDGFVLTITDSRGHGLFQSLIHGGNKSAQNNADHIVACVNNCAGINPKAVRETLEALKQLVARCADPDGVVVRSMTKNMQAGMIGPLVVEAKAAIALAEKEE